MKKYLYSVCMILFLSACTKTIPSNCGALATPSLNEDPLKPYNETMFKINDGIYEYALDPLAKGYRFIMPSFLQTGIANFLTNLRQPIYLINALLQQEGTQSKEITERFLINSIWGIGGLMDVASKMDVPKNTPDFGQTLYTYGVSSGPYIVLPILGPSTIRDASGMAANAFINPVDWALRKEPYLMWGRFAAGGFVDYLAMQNVMHDMKATSTSYYTTVKTMYLQNRSKFLKKNILEEKKEYEFDFSFEDE